MREITARRRPAAQPSVRRSNAAAPASDKLTPDAASSSRVSLSVNRRSPARISTTSSASRSWCSLSGGSRRDDSTTRAEFGRAASRRASCAERLSRSQLVEIVDDQHDRLARLGQLRTDHLDQLLAVRRRGFASKDRSTLPWLRSASRTADQNRCASCSSRSTDTNATRRLSGRVIDPRTQQRGLPASRRRRDDRDPLGHSPIQLLEELLPIEQARDDCTIG